MLNSSESPQKLPLAECEEDEKIMKDMETDGIIEPSTSP